MTSLSRTLLSRRSVASLLAGASLAPILGLPLGPALAQDRSLDVRKGGNFQPVPIAVTRFVGDGVSGDKVTSVILNDFKHAVFITPVGDAQSVGNPDQAPTMDVFRNLGAQYVLTGRVANTGDGRLQTQFRLWDVQSGAQVTGEQYVTDANNLRRVAHIVADAVFTQATGEKGFFDTRVVFIDESGPATRRRKRLAIMDQDGASVRYLTRGDDLVVTPRFSPTSQEITYMAFGGDEPRVLLMNIETGQREPVGNFHRHDLRAPLRAERQEDHHVPVGGCRDKPVRHEPRLARDDAAHRHAGDRHLAVLCSGREQDRVRIPIAAGRSRSM